MVRPSVRSPLRSLLTDRRRRSVGSGCSMVPVGTSCMCVVVDFFVCVFCRCRCVSVLAESKKKCTLAEKHIPTSITLPYLNQPYSTQILASLSHYMFTPLSWTHRYKTMCSETIIEKLPNTYTHISSFLLLRHPFVVRMKNTSQTDIALYYYL